jgi:hypothetical protein
MVEQIAEKSRLESLFERADIDDIELDLEADHSEEVVITFTERVTGDTYTVAASTLDEAADEAVIILDDRQAYRQLRANGFSGSDIAELVGRPDLVELEQEFDASPEGDAWRRGYAAGVVETGELYAEAYASAVQSASEPAVAGVGEPFGEPIVSQGIRIVPIDGSYLALVLPATVIHD